VFALSYDLPNQRLAKEVAARGFSRVPIFQKTLDNIRGILNAKVLVKVAAGQPLNRPLGEVLHEPLFVPRATPVKRLFLTFKQKKSHMAIVVSEYGKVLGIVTMDDLLAQIFGQLRDERAELQNTIPPGTRRAKTATGPGLPGIAEHVGAARFDESVPVGRVDLTPPEPMMPDYETAREAHGDTLDEPGRASVPLRESVPIPIGSIGSIDESGPIDHGHSRPDSDPGASKAILDPPPPPGLRRSTSPTS